MLLLVDNLYPLFIYFFSLVKDPSFALIATPNSRNIFAQSANIWPEKTTNRTIVKNVAFAGEKSLMNILLTETLWEIYQT